MQKKMVITFVSVATVFGMLLARLFYIAQNKPAQVAATQNRWTLTVASSRGTIYDTNLLPFVNEKRVYHAAVLPSNTLLAHLRDVTTNENFVMLHDQLQNGTPAAVPLTKPVGFTEGLRLFYTPQRYSNRLLAAHVIGYLDGGNTKGVYGIERDYDEQLSHYNGMATASFYVDASGRFLTGLKPESQDTTPRSSGGVILTLDKKIQGVVEDIGLQYIDKGAVIIKDPNTGEILALSSFPSFQANDIAASLSEDNGALMNRALSLYDCGSVFKIVTTAAALENGVSIDATFSCDGYIDVEGVRFHCHHRLGHGKLNMTDAFAQSCNVYYIQLAKQIGSDTLYSMATDFGLDQPILLTDSLVAKSGLLPDPQTLHQSKAALANFSFGQGYLMLSPMHIANIASVIENDGVLTPTTIVKGLVDDKVNVTLYEKGRGERVLSANTARRIQNMMRKVVQNGTGQAADSEYCLVSGKTGTAETGQITNDKPVIQSWFVGTIHLQSQQYVVCVLLEDAGNSDKTAASIARLIIDSMYDNGLIIN